MSKRASIILAVVTFLVGVIAGGWITGAVFGKLTSNLIVSQLAADAGMKAHTLKRLHAGDTTNAVELMEISLDGDLIGLGAILTNPHDLKCYPDYIKTLQNVRDYRIQFPRKSDLPEADHSIDNFFVLLSKQTAH